MTIDNLEQAKKNYKKLLEDREIIRRNKKVFLDYYNDSKIQEFCLLDGWSYFDNRVLELKQDKRVKEYLYLLEKNNDFYEYNDNDLVEFSFDNVISDEDSNSIYVYIDSFNVINGRRIKPLIREHADFHLYKDLETMKDRLVNGDELVTFRNNHKIITFKNKKHIPIELFYRYRIMYLRQFLLDNDERLFNNKRLIKELKTRNNSN